MEHYETEEQQWEAIKRWFKRHGNQLSWALIVVLSIISGTQYWRHHQSVVRERAAEQYMAFLITLSETDRKGESTSETDSKEGSAAFQKGDQLMQDFPHSPYASLTAFALAKEAATGNQLDKAAQYLRWVMDKGEGKELSALARVRLMRLCVAQNALDVALKLYDEAKSAGFLSEMAEIKGDILLKQEDVAGATTAYKKAYETAPSGMIGPMLKMKMENLGIDLEALQRDPKAGTKEENHA